MRMHRERREVFIISFCHQRLKRNKEKAILLTLLPLLLQLLHYYFYFWRHLQTPSCSNSNHYIYISLFSASMEVKHSISTVSGSLTQSVMNLNVGSSGGTTAPPPPPPAFIATTTTPGSTGTGQQGQESLDLLGKKKRGRPRKYDSEGNLRVGAPQGFSLTPTSPSSKRGRGRPFGPGNSQLLASLGMFAGTAGGNFTPHVVTVYAGEDVAGKIFSFAQKGPIGICILSANGAISKVTMRQPGSSGGILTYEGRFEILSLSGSFTVSDNGGISPTSGLSVSLAGPDGRVIGGGVAGLLTAAGPIQIVMGSFMPNGYKTHKRKHHREHTAASGTKGAPDTVAAPTPRPISQETPDATLNVADWNGTGEFSDQRPSPDINISLPDE